ncbi:MAG: PAS domain S-box protein, partial [Desulfobacterales bacterium]|nr:PAS domain S-box protein [Desulfobacterales bacterium]
MTAGNKRILVIDDDLEIWKAYKAVLEPERVANVGAQQKLGRLLSLDPDEDLDAEPRSDSSPVFQVRFAAQGQEGYALVKEAIAESMTFAAAFIDIRMPPGWDGMETAARIRQIDPNIEIVIVTAYSDRSRHEISATVGAPEKLLFLRKPFDPEELTQMALSLTEKWNLARKEEAQRRELQTVLRTTPAAIFTVDANGRINSWNPSAERITGYTAEEVVGKPCIFKRMNERVCGECPMDDRNYLDKSHESNIVDKMGRTRIISKSISYIRDGSGHVINAVESFWDITARKEAEAALQESEIRFRSLVETTSDWVWEIDADGRFTYCSPLCEMIYGYSPEELLGKSMFDVLIAPEEIDHCGEVFNRCIQNVCSFQVVERRSLRKDGGLIYIEFSGAPVIGENGEVVGFRGIDRDITERKRIEEERARLEEHYRQSRKMEALGTLAGGIAHDLNNILTPIIGNAQLCLLDMDPGHTCYSKLQDIVKSAETAADLIRQILAFSRKQMLVPSTLDLNKMIADFTKMLR